jgi:hypothetical protein
MMLPAVVLVTLRLWEAQVLIIYENTNRSKFLVRTLSCDLQEDSSSVMNNGRVRENPLEDGWLIEEVTGEQRAEILVLCWLHSNRRSTGCDEQSKGMS